MTRLLGWWKYLKEEKKIQQTLTILPAGKKVDIFKRDVRSIFMILQKIQSDSEYIILGWRDNCSFID